jgi:hypothetical protein
MKLRHYLLPIISLSLIGITAANSTMSWRASSLDYFWAPANILLFHIDYPYDFVLYFFMGVGFLYCFHWTLKVGFWLGTRLFEWLF